MQRRFYHVVMVVVGLLLCTTAFAQNGGKRRPPTIDPTYGMPLPKQAKAAAKSKPDAEWIWANHTTDTQVLLLRGTVTLNSPPKSARLYVTADNFFTAYVNGKQVAQTVPDPKDDLVWSHVKSIDVLPMLTAGKNVVAIRAQNAGASAGAIARLEVNGKPVLLTGSAWKVMDESKDRANWTAADFNDSAWAAATVLAPVTGGPWANAGGLEGWPGYLAASAPYLYHLPMKPVAVTDPEGGASDYEGVQTLNQPRQRLVLNPKSGAGGLVLDFGQELTGRVVLTGEGIGSVVVGTGESREEAVKSPWGGRHKLEVAPGRPAASPYSAFRYVHLTIPAGSADKPLVLTGVTLDHLYYPVQYKGSFDCSDSLLTRIWYMGAYTSHLCMQEDIWDAPKRDRARWMGDLHVSGEVINNVFADRFLMEQTMTRLREDAQGGAPPTALPRSHVNGIPGYSCAWVAGLADFHRHIGDYDYLKKQHDFLISTLEYFNEEMDERGIFANRRKAWPFVDWAPEFNKDTPLARAATHLFLIYAMKEAAFLFDEMGDSANAAKYRARAQTLTEAAQKYLSSEAGLFSDRRQENAMAIYSGTATPEQTRHIYDSVLKPGSPAWDIVATPYYNNYVIFAMSDAGHTDDAVRILRSHWGGMLEEGATSWWEGYDPKWDKNDFHAHLQADDGTGYFVSLAHGWSAGPTNLLTERVLGVRPTGGAFKTCDIEPHLGTLAWAEGDVPTPRGLLHVRVQKAIGGTVVMATVPAGVTARIVLESQVTSVVGPKQVVFGGK
jgi:alpha-L-rhamnosidase